MTRRFRLLSRTTPMNVATAPWPPPSDTSRISGSSSQRAAPSRRSGSCQPNPTIIKAEPKCVPEVVEDARAAADRERVLDGAGDVPLRALRPPPERRRRARARRQSPTRTCTPCRARRRQPTRGAASSMNVPRETAGRRPRRPPDVPTLDDDRRRAQAGDPLCRLPRAGPANRRRMPDSASASATFGVTTVATGSRRVFNIETASGASRVRLPRPLAAMTGSTTRFGWRNRPTRFGDRPHDVARSRACRS